MDIFNIGSTVDPQFKYNTVLDNINADAALTSILDRFSTDSIMDIINYSIENNFRLYNQHLPNLPKALEDQFIELFTTFNDNHNDIAMKRHDIYVSIIEAICNKFNLTFNTYDDTDYYVAASFIYQFFVSDFSSSMITFFSKYIIQERESLYTSFFSTNEEYKKSSMDISINYSKKIFTDDKLAYLHANIGEVLNGIKSFDISLFDIINTVYDDKNTVRFINFIITDNSNFFQNVYMNYILNPKYNSELVMYIKMDLQQRATNLTFS